MVFLGVQILFLGLLFGLCWIVYLNEQRPIVLMTFLGNLLILFGILALLLSGLFFFTGKKNEDFFSVRDNVKISIWNCFYPHENIDKKKVN